MFSADCTETNPLSRALVHWLEIRCGVQLKPVAAVAGFSKFSKPAPPTPNASRLVLSMILNGSVINFLETKLDRRE